MGLIKKTKQNLEDEQVSYIMTTIFFSQYINMGWILMVASADFENTPLSFLGIHNQFSDFSTDWYLVIGIQIQRTMLVQAFMPYIQFCMMYSI